MDKSVKTKAVVRSVLTSHKIEDALCCARSNQELEGVRVPERVIALGRRLLKKEITWEEYRKEALLAIR